MTSHPSRLLGLLALLTLTFGALVLGCSNTKESGDDGCSACAAEACGGDACGSACGACGGDACGGDGKSLEEMFPTWEEAQTLVGDAKAGEDYFNNKLYDSFMACASCHSFNKGDTMESDAGDLHKSGYSVWGSQHRTAIKGHSKNAALGGNICVTSWMGGPKEGMTAQELANLDAFLKTGGDKSHDTSANLDYKTRTYTIPETLTGGDAERGEELAVQYCTACHEIGDKEAVTGDVGERLRPGVVPTNKLGYLAKRIKDKQMDNNEFMPGFPDGRMPEQDLLDILAYFEKK